jgi:MoaA/NifB/PqqE/SkfB family radical SAM enzyme
METTEEIRDPPFLRNVGLLLTYHCQASCAHCIIRAGPGRHEEVSLEDARTWIRAIASYRDRYVYLLSLTGGEPFSNLDLLREVMQAAVEGKFYVSVATNGFWATSRRSAVALLHSLPRISFLLLSTDVYHQLYVPFEHIRNAIEAAQDCGIPYYVSMVTDDEDEPDFRRTKQEILKSTRPDQIRVGTVFPVGRAAQIESQLRRGWSPQPPKEVCQAASSPCIFPDGRVFGCIGPLLELQGEQPLYLGTLRDIPMEEILERAETNIVLHALRLWGPHRLIAMSREAGLGRYLPKEFVSGSICDACYRLLSVAAVREWLAALQKDADFRRKVAYGRLYYFNETGMLERGIA